MPPNYSPFPFPDSRILICRIGIGPLDQIRNLTPRVGPTNALRQTRQDGKKSKTRAELVKKIQKSLGLGLHGNTPIYSEVLLNSERAKLLNERELESVDIQWAHLSVTLAEFSIFHMQNFTWFIFFGPTF